MKNLTDLCYGVLEKARAKFDKPVTINSGFRCLELNRAIGSGDSSQHCKGNRDGDLEIRSS
ncbi:D-Ala-D-Ala carboxypeptidase family metallohydrolase [Pseudomonas sp. GNP014]